MKKIILYIFIFFGVGLSACKEGFLDVNEDPNSPTETTPNFLLPSIISNGLQIPGFTALRTNYINQYLTDRRAANQDFDRFIFTTSNSNATFNNTYFLVGGNIIKMIEVAEAEGSYHYVGAGKIMMALILSHATDMFGDIPYSEAWKGAANYTPKYDPQEQIYAEIFRLIDEGIADMGKTNVRPFYAATPSESGDILYKGVVAKWVKLANTLKARQMNHLTKKGNLYKPQEILTLLSKGFDSNADDAQLNFVMPSGPITGSTNIAGVTRNNYPQATFTRGYLNLLNGTTFNGVQDPRFPIIATPTSTGSVPGEGITPAPTATTDFYQSYYARETGYLEVITFAEAKFIEAEAALNLNPPADSPLRLRALNAYKAGIEAHMLKIGVSVAAKDAYLTSAAVVQNPNSLTIKDVMQQKYIAMFLNPETWVDLRRYDFNTTIYPNLVYPTSANTALKGEFPRRLLPAQTETVFNPEEVARIGGNAPDYQIKRVWWDMP